MSTHRDKRIRRVYRIAVGVATRCGKVEAYLDVKLWHKWVGRPGDMARYLMTLPGWDDDTLSVDRINPHGDYVPGNLRWATDAEQGRNRRNARRVRATVVDSMMAGG